MAQRKPAIIQNGFAWGLAFKNKSKYIVKCPCFYVIMRYYCLYKVGKGDQGMVETMVGIMSLDLILLSALVFVVFALLGFVFSLFSGG